MPYNNCLLFFLALYFRIPLSLFIYLATYLKEYFMQIEKGTEMGDLCTTASEILRRSLDYQELDKTSDTWNPVPGILEKSIPFLDAESQTS